MVDSGQEVDMRQSEELKHRLDALLEENKALKKNLKNKKSTLSHMFYPQLVSDELDRFRALRWMRQCDLEIEEAMLNKYAYAGMYQSVVDQEQRVKALKAELEELDEVYKFMVQLCLEGRASEVFEAVRNGGVRARLLAECRNRKEPIKVNAYIESEGEDELISGKGFR